MNAFKLSAIAAAFAAVTPFMASQAVAGGVIYNAGTAAAATVLMGINDEGHLNVASGATTVGAAGVAYKFPDGSFRDATSPGCLCEGWGVSVNGATSGYANVSSDSGAHNLSVSSFSTTIVGADTVATIANSTVTLTSLPGI
jgi:hypothetical protein